MAVWPVCLRHDLSVTALTSRLITSTVYNGVYKKDFVFDDDDNPVDSRHLVAALLTLAF